MKTYFVFAFYLKFCRTENSIKNHWNCSISKKITHSPYSDLYNFKTKAESRNSEVLKQNVDQKINLGRERNPETCSLDLVLGNASGREIHLATTDKKDCRFVREASDTMEPPNITVFDKKSGAACILKGGQGRESADTALAPRVLKLGCLNYEPVQLNDLNTPLTTSKFPRGICDASSSPITPLSHKEGIPVSCRSPASILRNAARTFKLPSIIRKRRHQTARRIGTGFHNDSCS